MIARKQILALVMTPIALCGACHQKEKEDLLHSISMYMLVNDDEPLGITIRATFVDPNLQGNEKTRIEMTGEFLFKDETETSYWVNGRIESPQFQWFFQQNQGGKTHTQIEGLPGEDPFWDCIESVKGESSVYAPVSVFPRGGVSLFSQIRSMLEELGPVEIEASGSSASLSWRDISQQVKADLLEHQRFHDGWDSYQVSGVDLEIDLASMLPQNFRVHFSNGAVFATEYQSIDFLRLGYTERVASMRVARGVDQFPRCVCD